MTDPITQARDWPATAERLKARVADLDRAAEKFRGLASRGGSLDEGLLLQSDALQADLYATDLRSALSYIAVLEAALEPFKAEAARWPAGLKDRHEPFPISPLKLGDFRRAAAALQKGADHA